VRVVAGIPARMGASRFPGKPLKPILGMPMVQHVYQRCLLAEELDDVFVATANEEIKEVVEGFGGRAIMTDPEIPRPGLRVAEAVREMDDLADDDIVIVVQGDEPLVHPGMMSLAARALLDDPELKLGTLVAPANEVEWNDPNEVKCVANLAGDLLYMTRSPVPFKRDEEGTRLKQVAIMPFRKSFLLEFNDLAMTPHERAESVELLRSIEHGVRTKAILSPYQSVSVDTEPDLREAEEQMKSDEFYPRYASA
jgi:3-deoxy-manno-octulosonate cytidylyltransferase (CMP-KDO synthetase)